MIKIGLPHSSASNVNSLATLKETVPLKPQGKKPIPYQRLTKEHESNRLWYHPATSLPKMLGLSDGYDLQSNDTFEPLVVDHSQPEKTKQSEQWFDFKKG